MATRSGSGGPGRQRRPFGATAAILLILAGCASRPTPSAVPPPPPAPSPPSSSSPSSGPAAPARAAALPLSTTDLALTGDPAAALAAFRKSCPALLRREDASGLTRPADWQPACAAAATADPASFFQRQFRAVRIAGGKGFVTGYFEPEIAGSRNPAPGYATPLYRRPPDLVEADLGRFIAEWKGRKLRGRVENGSLVPYPDRAAIMAGALAGKGLELAFAADPHEAFFLEIQGSGRLRLPDGSVMRIGYAGQNGRDYVAIGRVLVERGDLPRGGATMAAILAWLRSHRAEAPAVLAANPSVVFFREITGEGPIGALGIAVTPRVSVAADPAFVPLGAPVLVTTTLGDRPLAALMVAQDTGGAIRGANRLDLFRGAGATAAAEAGSLASPADVVVLLPPAAIARLGLNEG